MANILVIEDEDNLRFSIARRLRKEGHEVEEAGDVDAAWSATRDKAFDAILTDVNLGSENGVDLLERIREDGFEGAIIVMTAYGTIENAVDAMRRGADDFVQKPLSMEEVVLLIERRLETRSNSRRLRLYERLEQSRTPDVLGESEAWTKTLELAGRLASMPVSHRGTDAAGLALPTMLVLGETGTGKGVLARHMHRIGGEASGAFVHVNCCALPPTLIESELFGHEKGAFTDARSSREGIFEMAEGGTVLLDEIGDMPLELQAKVLTVIEEGRFRRVGGTQDRHVRTRIVAATNQDLDARVRDGGFRQDLLYRLNAFTIRIPPLRERGDDAILIAGHLLHQFTTEFNRPRMELGADAIEAIRAHTWPGNVRELANLMQRVAMLGDGPVIGARDLGLDEQAPDVPTRAPVGGPLVFDFQDGMHRADEVEQELMKQALEYTRGNVSKASKLIGMQRSSFRYRIERYGMEAFVRELAER